MSHEPGHKSSTDRLVMMANQISRALAHGGEEKAVEATAAHLRQFWDPRMRSAIAEHVERGGAGLDPCALKAVRRLAERK